MIYDFSIYEFLRRQLPNHKRQPKRLALFFWPLKEIKSLWDEFVSWRADMLYQSNITGQTLSLTHLLNKKITGANGSIHIRDTEETGIYISTLAEASNPVNISLESEDSNSMDIELLGEGGSGLGVSFQVVAPVGASTAQIEEIVNRYLIAGMSFTISQQDE
jgi:hypothetical protein